MKKGLVTIGAALLAGQAHAQNSVQINGTIDAGVTVISNEGGHRAAVFDSGIAEPNLLEFKGTADAGGGTKVIFDLLSQFDLGSGATLPGPGQIFNRTALIGITNDWWGRLTLGNQYDFMIDSLTNAGFEAGGVFGGLYNFRQGPFSGLAIPGNPTGAFDFDRTGGGSRVPDSVKYTSPVIAGFSVGAMYGFGNQAGDLAANSTVSFGANYVYGPLGVGLAYVEVKYPEFNQGYDGIRNWGGGAKYAFGRLTVNLLYTNTRNTFNGAQVNAVEVGAYYRMSPAWAWGADYQYMKGNSALNDNAAHQLTSKLQYSLSRRTSAYVEAVYQYAQGEGAHAWINGLPGLNSASSGPSQFLTRIGVTTAF
ncbi:porin [Paraburkholderia susongensis]|uniref:Outer membrane protein (Porin) n=1 Tax=Paraburkholderia susongensis TaxID=1515439 RepID=A0A1X7L685_9BURK|nr:porin [Paraburkholderia susongensis]SMG48974.1 Outer membrane protein (porin) [Paraburkholderia susongensis]